MKRPITHLLASLALSSVACGLGTPANTPSPQAAATTQQAELARAGCEANAQQLLALCSAAPTPLPSGFSEQLRRGVESQRGTCPADVLVRVDGCVSELERRATAQDPGAASRRAAGKPKADAIKQRAEFRQMIEQWLQAYDGAKIVCRHRDASASDARECERWKKDREGVEERLRGYLQREGLDARDFGELGLWPSSPDGPYR